MKRSSNQTMKRSITAPYASSWREYVITRACALDGELKRLVPHPDSPTTSPAPHDVPVGAALAGPRA